MRSGLDSCGYRVSRNTVPEFALPPTTVVPYSAPPGPATKPTWICPVRAGEGLNSRILPRSSCYGWRPQHEYRAIACLTGSIGGSVERLGARVQQQSGRENLAFPERIEDRQRPCSCSRSRWGQREHSASPLGPGRGRPIQRSIRSRSQAGSRIAAVAAACKVVQHHLVPRGVRLVRGSQRKNNPVA